MNILVSACLLGIGCRYDGKCKPNEDVIKLSEEHNLVPFCPEIYGGLPTPRVPSEIVGEKVLNAEGEDVTEQYSKGAEEAMKTCNVPVIFFHGDQDDLVPHEMSCVNYESCKTRKQLVIIPGAGHGLSYPVAPDAYLNALWDFFGKEASHPSAWPVELEKNA